ncbi:hypothetical protein ACOSQ4_023693 [Xanthoceras sorbifolium]
MFLASGSHYLNFDITSSSSNNNNNKNMSPFLDHYIVATFFASLFGFLLLFVLRLNNNKNMSPFLDHYIVATFFASLYWDEEMKRWSPASMDLFTHKAVPSSPHARSYFYFLKVAGDAPDVVAMTKNFIKNKMTYPSWCTHVSEIFLSVICILTQRHAYTEVCKFVLYISFVNICLMVYVFQSFVNINYVLFHLKMFGKSHYTVECVYD